MSMSWFFIFSSLYPELPVGGAQPELPVPSDLPSTLLILVLFHVLFILLFLAAGTGDRPATTAATTTTSAAGTTARHDGRTRVSTWWVNGNITSQAGIKLGEFGGAIKCFWKNLSHLDGHLIEFFDKLHYTYICISIYKWFTLSATPKQKAVVRGKVLISLSWNIYLNKTILSRDEKAFLNVPEATFLNQLMHSDIYEAV